MDRLPNDIFNFIRSHLTFADMHHLRRVSKRWEDLDSVEKKLLLLTRDKKPTTLANVRKLQSLRDYRLSVETIDKAFAQSSNTLQTLEIWDADDFLPTLPREFPKLKKLEFFEFENINLLRDILLRSPKLQNLKIDISNFDNDHLPHLPHSPQVQFLSLDGDLYEDASASVSNILQSFSKIKTFQSGCFNDTYIIDFSLCPHLEEITFKDTFCYPHFTNANMANLKTIDFELDNHFEEAYLTSEEIERNILLWIQHFPSARILFWAEEDVPECEDWFKIEIEIQNFTLKFRRFISGNNRYQDLFIDLVANLLKLMNSVREFSIQIDSEMPKEEAYLLFEILENAELLIAKELEALL